MTPSEIKLKILFTQRELEKSKTRLMLEEISIEALERMLTKLENKLSKEDYETK